MEKKKLNELIKRSTSFPNNESMTKLKNISNIINTKNLRKINSLNDINIDKTQIIKDILNKNKNFHENLNIKNYINFNKKLKPITIFERANIEFDKIKDLNNKIMGILKKNIRFIDNELFYKKFNKYKFKNCKSFNSYHNLFNKTNESKINTNTNINKNTKNISNYIETNNCSNYNKITSYDVYKTYNKFNNMNYNSSKINITTNNNISLFSIAGDSKITNKSNDFLKSSISSNFSPIKQNSINNKLSKIYSVKKLKNGLIHKRNFIIDEKTLINHINEIFNISPLLMSKTYTIKDPVFQLKCIMNKIKLIIDNIEYFKSNYINKNNFNKAFKNMTNKDKAKFNLILEEICTLLLKLIPLLLKNFNNTMDKLLYSRCPDIKKESLKEPENEKDCLNMNCIFLNKIIIYFQGCIELYKVIQIKIIEFKYDINEFNIINIFLDLLRYNSSRIICISNTNIQKVNQEQELIQKIDIKRENIKNKDENSLERYHRRHKIIRKDNSLKLNRINHVLNMKNKVDNIKYLSEPENSIYKKNNKPYHNLLNSFLINSMMKYFKENVRTQIIAQQLIERYNEK